MDILRNKMKLWKMQRQKSQNIFLVIRKHVFRVMEREKCTDYSMR